MIHLVDDDPDVRGTLARLLVSGGYTVSQYSSGTELLNVAGELREGLVLLDINMPGHDGFAVYKMLRDKGIKLPVVMMTGSGDLTILALKAGATEFMQKPFGRSQLLSIIDNVAMQPDQNIA